MSGMAENSPKQSYSLRALLVLIVTVILAIALSASAGWFVRTETAPKERLDVKGIGTGTGGTDTADPDTGGLEEKQVDDNEEKPPVDDEEKVVTDGDPPSDDTQDQPTFIEGDGSTGGDGDKPTEDSDDKPTGDGDDKPAEDETDKPSGDGEDPPSKEEEPSKDESDRTPPPKKKKKGKVGANPCDDGEYPELSSRICTSWRELVYDQRMYAVDANGAKYMVCVPPKNGSTYHRGLIFRILGVDGYDKKHTVHFDDDAKDKMFLVNFTDAEIADFVETEGVERYAMIRNPMQRTLSGFMNAQGRKLPAGVDRAKYFQEWVMRELPRKNLGSSNQHFRPQWAFCGFKTAGIKDKFKMFRVEEPEKYVDYLYSIIPNEFLKDGWGEGVGFREYVLGPRKRTHGTDEMFWRYVGKMEVFDMIAKVMKDDIEFLGYEEDVKAMRVEFEKILKQGGVSRR